MTERFLVTGAAGCLGAWTVGQLIGEGVDVVAYDLNDDRRRLELVSPSAAEAVRWVTGDIRDLDEVVDLVAANRVTHIVHLAALQVPFCRADPVMGAQVNVTGSVNVLEAVRRADGNVRGLVYASSAAVFGPGALYPDGIADDAAMLAPGSLYGVYKQANEWTARIYYEDWGVSSIGVRPSIVYGPGRDQGMTSTPTVAMLRAAVGLSTHIGFGGSSTYHHAEDVAAAMITAARLERDGAPVFNVGGSTATMVQVAAAIMAAAPAVEVTFDDVALALPAGLDGSGLAAALGGQPRFRDLDVGIHDAVRQFRDLVDRGLLHPSESGP